MPDLPAALCLALLLVGLCGLLMNILLLIIILRSPLLSRKGQPVFIHIFSMVLGKTFQLLIIVFYIAPSIAFQRFPFQETEYGDVVLSIVSYAFYTFWVHSCCSNTVLAFSRFVIIICADSPLSSVCASRLSVFCQSGAIWCFSAILSLVTQFVLPCCHVKIDYLHYGYSYEVFDGAFNYSKYYVNLPANIIHTIIFFMFYASIVVFLWKHRIPVGSASRRESELAVQFLFIAAFFSLTWISFNILPQTSLGSLPATVMLECDCAAAAMIYLTMNRDIRRYIRGSQEGLMGCSQQSVSAMRKSTLQSSYRYRPAARSAEL
ncbi:unnamed protein product, partial [Mesorhabditis belari]|uniref:7TM GPCR serpentine receptor class x (Srx) domain-containing protein n=1 Tax=Mesorhabditis belari TaxID=2138241 RepID=A0AAF3FD71_9BILA